jgi:PKD repeat protein
VGVLVPPPEALVRPRVPRAGVAPLTCSSDDRSTGAIASWSWDFGDGGSSSLAEPQHVYAAPGSYAVALTVSGPGGSSTLTQDDAVQVAEPAPVAAFGATPELGAAPLTVQFPARLGRHDAGRWTFGDGASSSLQNPAHVYATPGTYTVTLTASGPAARTARRSRADRRSRAARRWRLHAAPTAAWRRSRCSSATPARQRGRPRWDFGDGASSTRQPVARVRHARTYTVTLDRQRPRRRGRARRSRAGVQVTPPPWRTSRPTPREGYAPLQVVFTDPRAAW